MKASQGLSIGDIAARTGLAVSAIRYYEAEGLIAPWRNAGQFGFTLSQIKVELDQLPRHRAPSRADWTRIAQTFRVALDARIAQMEKLRDTLDGCIGCGCLSLDACALYNPADRAGRRGSGPRYLMGNRPNDTM